MLADWSEYARYLLWHAFAALALLASANRLITAQPVQAAEASVSMSHLTAILSDGGSSSRDSRRQAIAAIPLKGMSAVDRQTVDRCLRSTTVYRRLPAETVICDQDLLEFALQKPEAIVDIWRTLGISRLVLDKVAPRQWRLADGFGTVGSLRLLQIEQRGAGCALVLHGRGAYSGPLSPTELTGTCLLVVQCSTAEPTVDGRTRQTVQIDAFVDMDGIGLEIVTRTLQPLIVRSAAANVHEICLFMASLSKSAAENPSGVVHLTNRLNRTDPADRRELAAIARAAAVDGQQRSDDPAAGQRLQAELASRWLPAEELDRLQRR
ncbi:MAG: hypothetical protein NTY87_11510 [Planctomycetia bacterium]|nr:hypothetical protein [Planctomycetia bacterium]RLT13361.1 MAG: hypothetical protein DWI25_07285 [Planctomycetota bacterium]